MDFGPFDALWLAVALTAASLLRWALLLAVARLIMAARSSTVSEPEPDDDPIRQRVRSRLLSEEPK